MDVSLFLPEINILWLMSYDYNDINNLVVIGRWWWQNLILNHVWYIQKQFLLFWAALSTKGCKVSKNANKIKTNFLQKFNMAIKKHKIWCLFWQSIGKIQKLHAKKRLKSEVFTFITVGFLHQIFRFMITISKILLILSFLANFIAKRGQNGPKNEKHIL